MKILDTPRSGKCGQVVAYQSRYGLCLRTYLIPRNNVTPARQRMRGIFGGTSRMWGGALTEGQRDRWNAAGPNVMSHPSLGQQGPLTGQQFCQAINSVRGCVGLPPTLEPPAAVRFGPSVVGPLEITNDENGVRLWLVVSGELAEDVMVFGQEPCPAGRYKRRNVVYLGLLSPAIGGRVEITALYRGRYGEPRPGRKVFIVTCQTKDGWKGIEREASEIVPERQQEGQRSGEGAFSQKLYMHKGCTRGAQEREELAAGEGRAGLEGGIGAGECAGAASGGEEERNSGADGPVGDAGKQGGATAPPSS